MIPLSFQHHKPMKSYKRGNLYMTPHYDIFKDSKMRTSITSIGTLFLTIITLACMPSISKADNVLLSIPGVDIITDVGYYISIDNTDPITITSDARSNDPIRSFTGSTTLTFESNVVAQIYLSIEGTSMAGGSWDATASPDIIGLGTTDVIVAINVSNLNLLALPGGTTGFKVAQLTISVLPLPTA